MKHEIPILQESLQRCRARLGMSGQTVAQLCQMSKNVVYELENGQRGVSAWQLLRLADFYHVSTDWLLGRDESQIREPPG